MVKKRAKVVKKRAKVVKKRAKVVKKRAKVVKEKSRNPRIYVSYGTFLLGTYYTSIIRV